MTLGVDILPGTGRRIAGLSIPWGQSITLGPLSPVGAPVEIVRAGIGGPVTWNAFATLQGVAIGDVVRIIARPALGAAAGSVELGPLSSVTPSVSSANVAGAGLPATELVVSWFLPAALAGPAVLTVVCCPLFWPHWASPQRVNP